MNLVPFHVEHLWDLRVDESHNRDGRHLLRGVSVPILEQITATSWSIAHEGRILACGGRAATSWWLLCEPAALRWPLTMTRIIRKTIRANAQPGDVAHALDETAAEWLEVLGFVRCPQQHDPSLTRYEWPQ